MEQTYIQLNDGNRIPQIGLGVFLIPDGPETERAVADALALGMRHIDTAHAYQNERSVGLAIRRSGIAREEIWITSKLWPHEYGEGVTLEAIDKMLERLDTDYLDLLLLHQQFGSYIEAWKDMERAVERGKVRSIGLSNFESGRLEEVLAAASIPPSVLQVECHPYYQQGELKKRLAAAGTRIEAWYPIGHGDRGLIEEPLFTELGAKYQKSNVQIILRWHLQEGHIVFPKTTKPRHLQENFDLFDFALTEEEMNRIRSLDNGKRFFTMTLEEQESQLSRFRPAD